MRFLRFPRPAGTSDEQRRRSKWAFWMRRSLACLVGLVALVAVLGSVLLRSLDQPWLKRRLQGAVRASAGVDIDYRAARVGLFSGAHIDGLVVASPAEVRPFASDLVRVGTVDACWSLGSLLLGRGPTVERLEVSDVALTIVVDEHGRTSLDALTPSGSKPTPGPTVPLSRKASKFLGTAPPVGRLDVGAVTLALVRTEHGEVVERGELRGLSLALATSLAQSPVEGWRIRASLGSAEKALDLALARQRANADAGAARARFWFTVDATSSALAAALDLRMIDQTFATSVSADHWIHAEANLRFDPIAGRTEVRVDHTDAGDGAATVEASVEISDAGETVVRSARGDIDVGRLLGWLPAGLVPVTAERARLRCQIDSLALAPVAHLSDGGTVAVDASLANVVLSGRPGPLEVGSGEISLRAQAAEGGVIVGHGTVKLGETRFAQADGLLAIEGLTVDFDGKEGTDAEVAGRVGLGFARIERGGASAIVARNGKVELRVEKLHLNAEQPLATRGDVGLSFQLASLDARLPGARAIVDGLALRAHTTLEGHPPYAIELEAPASRLRVTAADGHLLADAPMRIELRGHDLRPDAVQPVASRGSFHASMELGDIQTSLDTTKSADALDFALHGAARSLRAVRTFLSGTLAGKVPVDQMALTLHSTGHVEPLAGGVPSVTQTTEIELERPGFRPVAAQRLSLTVKSQGTAIHHQAQVDLRIQGLAVGGGSPSDEHATLSAKVDRGQPSLTFQLATEGHATTKLSGSLSFDPSRRAILYETAGHVAGLAPLAAMNAQLPGLAALDLSALDVGFSARGTVLGVVAAVSHDGSFRLEPKPSRTVAIEGQSDLRVAQFRWAKGDTAVIVPLATWHAQLASTGTRRTMYNRVDVRSLHLDLGSRDVDLNGISDDASFTIAGDLVDPEIGLTQRLSIDAVEQNVVPEYPLGDLEFALSGERGPEGVMHISDMKLTNGLGGTAFNLTGNVDLGEGRRTLSVTTALTQELSPLSTIPDRFKGRGRVAIEANVTSPDFVHYSVRAAVKGQDVSVSLARAGIEVEAANGEVPVTVALEVGENGVALQRSEKGSPFSMLRFADQHPLLSRSGFLSIGRIRTPFVSIAPLVGNLEIEQNVISLRQFEMGVRGGTITGLCGVDWEGPKSTVELHVRANGVKSSHGEPFDGNIAVAFSAADRTIDGRAEILRIGERHLLDLLDMQDPLHVDPAMNRIRTALAFGYPDTLRLVFDHGFASAHLELGGLARLVSIGELRGIPMGPIVDKMIARMLEGTSAKETP